MTLRTEIISTHPEFPWLDPSETTSIEAFLHQRGWIDPDEHVTTCGKAGEGNMNLTLRIATGMRSIILKQARPWVEKYDHIPAPWDRILYEQGFYERIKSIPDVAAAMPELLASDSHARAIVLEDLGAANDFTNVYNGDSLAGKDRQALAAYLAVLHTATREDADPEFVNREMRLLNHEHIFVFPLAEDNGIDLEPFEPELHSSAEELRGDSVYLDRLQETGDRYLADGPCLLHGDYFPGSWLHTPQGLRIIDPEFCYYGDPEFDLGVGLAHLRLAGRGIGEATQFLNDYRAQANELEIQERWIARYASSEIMRRLLGVAQLPIAPSIKTRRNLLADSRRAMTTETIEALWS